MYGLEKSILENLKRKLYYVEICEPDPLPKAFHRCRY